MTTLLLCGSRALCVGRGGTVESEQWAHEQIAAALRGVARLVTGDAVGPDAWAWREAMRLRLTVESWHLDGPRVEIADSGLTVGMWTTAPRPPGNAWRDRCLARDRAMVAALPDGARVVALVAPWSRTGGALYTARHAERRGLAVEVLTCPAKYGAMEGGR